jgi:hypothetical protein
MFPIAAAFGGLILGLSFNGNPLLGGLICGGMFGLVAWALTGFKLGESKPQEGIEPSQIDTESNSSKMPPVDFGRTLALSLFVSVKPSKDEIETVEAYGINSNLYFNEVFFLCAFGIVFAVFKELNSPVHVKLVMHGFHEVLSEHAKESDTNSKMYHTLVKRIDSYMQVAGDYSPDSLSPIALKFGEYIDANTWMKAYEYADTYFLSHANATKLAIAENTFIPQNALA